MVKRIARYVVLGVVTVGAIIGMIAVSASVSCEPLKTEETAKHTLTTTAVTTVTVEPQDVAVVERYSGRLRPTEQFTVSFEIAGRLRALGRNDEDEMLDEGMRIRPGQPLAQLDNRLMKAEVAEAEAQLDEAKAKLEKAEANLARVEDLQREGGRVITPEEYEERVFVVKESRARLKMADARLQQAQKRLDDAIIHAPAAGVITKRYVIPGESLSPNEPVFDIVQIDEVLLVVGVPDKDVRRIEKGQEVSVEFIGRDARGKSYPARTGTVRFVPPASDETSGLFRVEIVLENADGDLRPGLIGLARVTTETLPQAFRIPLNAVIFRSDRGKERATIYTVTKERPSALKDVALEDANAFAREYELKDWIEQGREIVVSELPPDHREVVVRGQYRLVDGRPVRVLTAEEAPQDTPKRTPGAIADRG